MSTLLHLCISFLLFIIDAVYGGGCYYEEKIGYYYHSVYDSCLTGCCGPVKGENWPQNQCCSDTGAKVGIGIGIIVFIGLIVGVCFFVRYKRRQSSTTSMQRF